MCACLPPTLDDSECAARCVDSVDPMGSGIGGAHAAACESEKSADKPEAAGACWTADSAMIGSRKVGKEDEGAQKEGG